MLGFYPCTLFASRSALATIGGAGFEATPGSAPIVTEVVPLQKFYPGEDDHQDYFERNPRQRYCQIVIAPKVAKFRKPERLKR